MRAQSEIANRSGTIIAINSSFARDAYCPHRACLHLLQRNHHEHAQSAGCRRPDHLVRLQKTSRSPAAGNGAAARFSPTSNACARHASHAGRRAWQHDAARAADGSRYRARPAARHGAQVRPGRTPSHGRPRGAIPTPRGSYALPACSQRVFLRLESATPFRFTAAVAPGGHRHPDLAIPKMRLSAQSFPSPCGKAESRYFPFSIDAN